MHWKERQMNSENRNRISAKTILGLGKEQIRKCTDEAALRKRNREVRVNNLCTWSGSRYFLGSLSSQFSTRFFLQGQLSQESTIFIFIFF